MAKVLLAIPTENSVHRNTSMLAAQLARYGGVDYATTYGRPADYARNNIVRMLLDGDWSHVMFIDSDTEPPGNCIDRLLALDSPLAGGCYGLLMAGGLRWALSNKDKDQRYRLLKELPSRADPFEVDGGGAGCLLVRRSVFEMIDWPWFRWVEHEDGSQTSEDIFFFEKCNAAGLRLAVDPTVICRHFKEVDVTALLAAKNSNT